VQPYVIVAGVADVYLAPFGTSFPLVNASPGTQWTYLGHTDGGVRVAHPQTIVELRTDQVTAPVKMVRSEESLEITFALAEITLENYAFALNQAAPSSDVGPPADKVINLYRGGFGVNTFAMLVRGAHLSPYGDFNLQYEVPSVFQADNPEVNFTKDAKALLQTSWHAIGAKAFNPGAVDADIFGVLRAETA
jgi:hypothetical protein